MPHNSVSQASESAGDVEMTDKRDESMDVSPPVEIETKSKDSTDAAQSATEITDVGEEMDHMEPQAASATDCVAGDEGSSMIAVDETGRIIATGAEAERLIAAHQAMQEQQLQQEQQQQQEEQQQQQPEAPSSSSTAEQEAQQPAEAHDSMVNDEDQLFQSAADQQMMEAATGEPSSETLENAASAPAQPTDILQQAFEASGAVTTTDSEAAPANPPAELTPGELVEQAVAQVHGSEVAPADSGTVVAKVEQQENTPPLGSCDNPIQIIQQGNTYHSTQTLSQEQLQQIAHVLQQQQVAKAIKNGGSAVVFNPATNTRIIYRVIYPNGAERKDKASTPNRITKTAKIVKQHPKGYKGRGRPAKRFDDDINPEGSSMSKEERDVLKKQVPRTRSGRISRPPSYMVRDYKRIHHLDFHEEPPPDNSDGGYSDIDIEVGEDGVKRKRRKLVLGTDLSLTGKPKRYRCPQCDHAYISSIRLSKHFRDRQHGDPDNIPPPVNVEDFVETEVEEDDEEVKKKEEEQKEKRKQIVRRSYVDMVSSRKKNRLREALRQCNDKEILDVCLHRVAKASTMWQILLAKSEEGDPPKPDVSTMLVHLETLLQQTEKLGKNFLIPADGKQEDGDDMVELIDEMVAAALGNRKPGMYRVVPEAYDPELDFLVKPNYLNRPRDVVRNYPPEAHPAKYITDIRSFRTWWQSETLWEDVLKTPVDLTIDFQRPYIVYHIFLHFHASSPDSFVIYKRRNATSEWEPFKYYSRSCETDFNLEDMSLRKRGVGLLDNRATCTSDGLGDPLQGGTMAFRPLEDYNDGATDDTTILSREAWLTASQIRISLRSLNTFGDDIMMNERSLRSYYYAVSDINIGARCQCHGHAKECKMDPRNPGYRQCFCEHNTEGEECERCLPLFNNRPWAAATAQSANECQQCNCNGRSNTCVFDPELYDETNGEIGGRCVGCIDNRDGVQCEKCKENHYEDSRGMCVPCSCNARGSSNLQCLPDGKCVCKPGVDGRYCDRCMADHFDFTDEGCKACECNVAGSRHSPPQCNVQTGKCDCKDNVEGQRCDLCKPGFFFLDAGNDRGCVACFCHGHFSSCASDNAHFKETITSEFKRGLDKWTAENDHGEPVQVRYEQSDKVISVDAKDSMVYFVAPEAFLGDRRFSYNRFLNFTLRIDSEFGYSSSRDIVIEGPNNMAISAPIIVNRQPTPNALGTQYSVRLHELFGWQPSLAAVEFNKLLKDVRKIKIRGTYQQRGQGFLEKVSLDSATTGISDIEDPEPAPWVEMCGCKEGYQGQFCEQCKSGYRRDPFNRQLGPYAVCERCKCNNHSDSCDSETGRCICKHNTAGMFCEQCETGFYGNPLIGKEDDCQPCPCPGQGKCTLRPDNTVMCMDCPSGYKGMKCERCDEGFYGDPQGLLGPKTNCTLCECNGNVDRDSINYCNSVNGKCLKCIYNTAGDHCEVCKSGYYGNALAEKKGDCKRCNCHVDGTRLPPDSTSKVLECSMTTGQCDCLLNVEGLQCDRCREGYWNLASKSGCESCACNTIGSKGPMCDVVTGVCACQTGVMEPKCDACLPYHWGFSAEGCQPCECDPIGSSDMQCDVGTGQCNCRPNFVGKTCNKCTRNTFLEQATCKNCDYCYDLILEAVEEHEKELDRVDQLLEDVQTAPPLDSQNSREFEVKMKEILQKAEKLAVEASTVAGLNGDQVEKFNAKVAQMKELKTVLEKDKLQVDAILSKTGILREKSQELKEVLDRNRHMISQVTNYVENDAVEAYNTASQQATKQSNSMTTLSSEVRAKLNKTQAGFDMAMENVQKGRQQAMLSLEFARELTANATSALATVSNFRRQQAELRGTMARVVSGAEKAQEDAKKVADLALNEVTEVQSTRLMEDENLENITSRASSLNNEALQLSKSTVEARAINDPYIKKAREVADEAEITVDEARKQQQHTDKLILEVTVAFNKSQAAVEEMNTIFKNATDKLERLRSFDKTSNERKQEALVQIGKIPDILSEIDKAQNKHEEELIELADVEFKAGRSKAISSEVKKLADSAKELMRKNKEATDQNKQRVADLSRENDRLEEIIKTANGQLQNFYTTITDEQQRLDQVSMSVSEAKRAAVETKQLASSALAEVKSILFKLSSADAFDPNHLSELAKRLDFLENQFKSSQAKDRTDKLIRDRQLKEKAVKDQKREIEALKAEVKSIADIRESLPDACFKEESLEPQAG